MERMILIIVIDLCLSFLEVYLKLYYSIMLSELIPRHSISVNIHEKYVEYNFKTENINTRYIFCVIKMLCAIKFRESSKIAIILPANNRSNY